MTKTIPQLEAELAAAREAMKQPATDETGHFVAVLSNFQDAQLALCRAMLEQFAPCGKGIANCPCCYSDKKMIDGIKKAVWGVEA